MAFCSILFEKWSIYHARIFRKAIRFLVAWVFVMGIDCFICPHQNLGNHCCRWHHFYFFTGYRFLDRRYCGGRSNRHLYSIWRLKGSGLHRYDSDVYFSRAGAIALTVFGLDAAGGWGEVKAIAGEDALSLWRPMSDPDFPWTGILFGAPILGVWYWCTDQFIVQRVLSAKNVKVARQSTIFAGYLKLLPIFIFVIPGVIAFALAQKGLLQLPINAQGHVEYDAALPALTMQLLPAGLRGLVVAGLLAALMSSLSSVFNSCSTLFTMDIYRKYFPRPQKSLFL